MFDVSIKIITFNSYRYLGKELIRFFGHRMGKSVAVMILSAASAHFNPSMATQVRKKLPSYYFNFSSLFLFLLSVDILFHNYYFYLFIISLYGEVS
jgi:hypothetical protein